MNSGQWKLYRLVASTIPENETGNWVNYIVKSNGHKYSPAFNVSENRFAQGGEILRLEANQNAEEIKRAIREDARIAWKEQHTCN